jgi:adenine deaminase
MEYVSGEIVDVVSRRIFKGVVAFENGVVQSVSESDSADDCFIMPGFVDAHVHVESSLLPPSEFSRIAMRQGVVAAVADPHEIANVLGVDGVRYMVDDANQTPFRFVFAAPSCVPATSFETSGATIGAAEVDYLFSTGAAKLLGEMMNFPGVVDNHLDVVSKLHLAKTYGYKIDGHAPGLIGEDLEKYVRAGIETDHECTSLDEAIEKIKLGMMILIRQGSAAQNLPTLAPLFEKFPDKIMLCTDDMHADNIIDGYLRNSIKYLLLQGYDFFDVIRSCTYNPVKHYKIDLGLLQVGDAADFIVVDNLNEFNVQYVYLNGAKVDLEAKYKVSALNNFDVNLISESEIEVERKSNKIRVIEVVNRELYTKELFYSLMNVNNMVQSNVNDDILKIVVVCRYGGNRKFVGFVKGFGLKSGAFATSISHDSHNIIAVGVRDVDIVTAINEVVSNKGAICFAKNGDMETLKLPIAGLMSDQPAEFVSEKYALLEKLIKQNGSKLDSPIMNLSFLALLVIPELKINERGLFDFRSFSFVDLFV